MTPLAIPFPKPCSPCPNAYGTLCRNGIPAYPRIPIPSPKSCQAYGLVAHPLNTAIIKINVVFICLYSTTVQKTRSKKMPELTKKSLLTPATSFITTINGLDMTKRNKKNRRRKPFIFGFTNSKRYADRPSRIFAQELERIRQLRQNRHHLKNPCAAVSLEAGTAPSKGYCPNQLPTR